MIYCGIDIIEIARIKNSIEEIGETFINKIYTKNEITYCESKKSQKYQHYAARFAAKEAAFKAISKLIKNKYDISWQDIEVLNDENGRPVITISKLDYSNIENIDISLSHNRESAIANVILLIK